MSNKSHVLRHLIHVDPKAAGDQILKAIWDAQCHKGNAAKALGCRHGTMLKWIAKLGIEERVEQLIERAKKSGHYGVSRGSPNGWRPFEVVDAAGARVGTYGSKEAADARASEERGLKARKRRDAQPEA